MNREPNLLDNVSINFCKKLEIILIFEFFTTNISCSWPGGFSNPAPIQAQAQCWSIIASGHDIIGIAETGSQMLCLRSLMMLILSPSRKVAVQRPSWRRRAKRALSGKMFFVIYRITSQALSVADGMRKLFIITKRLLFCGLNFVVKNSASAR